MKSQVPLIRCGFVVLQCIVGSQSAGSLWAQMATTPGKPDGSILAQATAQRDGFALDHEAVATSELLEEFAPQAHEQWDLDIEEFDRLNQAEVHPEDSILFIGSSSIRLWETIEEDVAPFHPIQRGYGGAKYTDVAVFAERLLHPHRYRALVVFVGNDVTGNDDDRTIDQVIQSIRHILHISNAHRPDAPVLIVEITPTRFRFRAWKEIRQVNAAIRELCLTSPNVYFVPTAEYYLQSDKQPRTELFGKDRLHLNRAGYRLWGRLIRQRLEEVLRGPVLEAAAGTH